MILSASQLAKRERAAKRKQLRLLNDNAEFPVWFLNPMGDEEEKEEQVQAEDLARQAQEEASRAVQEMQEKAKLEAIQRQEALKLVRSRMAPKKRIAHRQRK